LQNATHATGKQYGAVDNLIYAYQGNRLKAVDDAVTGNQLPRPTDYHGAPTSLAGDFQEQGVKLGQEYLYDANGNLTQDKNKGITGIVYNHLNLPKQIHFGSVGDSIVFRYTATGQKVAKLVYQTGKLTPLRTDYLGPYQYEQDSLKFFPHAEGRVLHFVAYDAAHQPKVRYQREFTFQDHLGNLRLAYRAGQTRTYLATLEQDDNTRKRETQQFDSLSVSPPIAVATPYAMGLYAARLNGGGAAPQPLGPLTQLTVQKGDTLRVSVSGLYPQKVNNPSFAFSLASFVASLVQPAPAGSPTGVDGNRRGGLPLLQLGLGAGLAAPPQLRDGVPKGYLRVLVFNQDSVLIDQRTLPLTKAALGNYEVLHDTLTIRHDGYVTVYVGNESAADVYFDELRIEHRQGLQVQHNYGGEVSEVYTMSKSVAKDGTPLVHFPTSGDSWIKVSNNNYLNLVVADIVKISNKYIKITDNKLQVTQLTGSRGYHSGYKAQGGNADVRYANVDGNDTKSRVLTTSMKFYNLINQILTDIGRSFGFDHPVSGIFTENGTANGPAFGGTHFLSNTFRKNGVCAFSHQHHMHLNKLNKNQVIQTAAAGH
jgi:hypothetical protein